MRVLKRMPLNCLKILNGKVQQRIEQVTMKRQSKNFHGMSVHLAISIVEIPWHLQDV